MSTWAAYALVWLAALTSSRWAPKDADIGFALIAVLGFGLMLVLVMAALILGITLGGMALRRHSAQRTWGDLLLLSLSALGLVVHAIVVKVFWFGAL